MPFLQQQRRRFFPCVLLLVLAASGQEQPPAFSAPGGPGASHSVEQLSKLLGIELTAEEKREVPKLQGFHEYQDMADLDCQTRLLLLMNRSITLRDELRQYHGNIAGLAGLYVELLTQMPQENSWIWLLLSSRERVSQKVHSHWSKLTSMALDRQECLMTDVRRLLLEAVVHWKDLNAESAALTWNSFAFGSYGATGEAAARAEGLPTDQPWAGALVAGDQWIMKVREWFDKHATALFYALEKELPQSALLQGELGASRMHHQDEQGMFVNFEQMRRKAFSQWALDRGLLRGLLKNVWRPPFGSGEPVTVADFGAGGGQYSTWLNDTGLVRAFAFDGTKQDADSPVQELNLIKEAHLWRTFDWVMCLEVGEHVPKQFAKALLANLRRHAKLGLVMSWSDDWEGIGHVNCLPKDKFIAFVEEETGLKHDPAATEVVKQSCEIDYIARTIGVFRAPDAPKHQEL